MAKIKRKRAARVEEEKGTIGTPSLSGGGKKNPAGMSGGSGIIDDNDRETPYMVLTKEDLSPGMNIEKFGTEDLFAAHYELHHLFRKIATTQETTNFTVADVVNLHARVVDELFERERNHPPPPDDGLDDNSNTFERHASQNVIKMAMPFGILSEGEKEPMVTREDVYTELAAKNWEDDNVSADEASNH